MGRQLVGTGDVHYLRREDYHHHTALLCVQTKSTLAAPKMTFETNEFYLRSSEEMARDVRRVARRDPDDARDRRALQRRDRARPAADPALPARGRGRAGLPARPRRGGPARPLRRPAAGRGRRAHGVRARRHRLDGLQRLLPDRVGLRQVGEGQRHRGRPGPRLGRRLDRRLLLRITDLDPLRYDLLFERFLNPERVSMPDIDIDFSVRGRERVMQLRGRASTAASRSRRSSPSARCSRARRRATPPACSATTTARATAWPSSSPTRSWAARRASRTASRTGEPLRAEYDKDPIAKQIVDVAKGLEGIVRNNSIHAAAVVIAGMPLTDIVPLQLADANETDAAATRSTGRSRSSR